MFPYHHPYAGYYYYYYRGQPGQGYPSRYVVNYRQGPPAGSCQCQHPCHLGEACLGECTGYSICDFCRDDLSGAHRVLP